MADEPSEAPALDAATWVDEEALFRSMLDDVSDGIVAVSDDGSIVFANSAAADTFGYRRNELVGMSLLELFPERVAEKHVDEFHAFLDVEAPTSDRSSLELAGRHRTGRELPVRLSFDEKAMGDERLFTVVVDDLSTTEMQDVETTGDQLSPVVNEVRDYAMFTMDADGRIQSWNKGANQIKGYEREEAIGEHFSMFYTDEDAEAGVPERNLERAIENGRVEDEGWRIRKDGSRFWANVVITPLFYDDGSLRGFVKVTRDMTERREQEEKLRKERELSEKILDTAPIAISVTSPEGETLRANDRAAELLGLTKEELLTGIEDEELRIRNPDGDELTDEDNWITRVLATGEPVYNREVVIEQPHEARTWVSVSAAPVFDGDGEVERVVSTGQEITELKELQRELERERDELQAELDEIFSRITEGMFALDDEWRITYANENMEEVTGKSESELVGQTIWEVFPEVRGSSLESEYREAMDRQEPTTVEEQFDDVWFELHLYPSESGLSVYFRDVTERKRNKQRLQESNAQLERFAYVTSHDLQEPLRMVSSYLQLLERRYADELDEDAREFIDYAVDGAERMSEMIDDLLEYSRVGRSEEEFEPVDCDRVLDRTLENLRGRIDDSDAEVTVDSLPTVTGDEKQLVQLFQNLLSNGIKYAGDSPPRLDVSAERDGAEWVFAVRDNGIGIEPDQTDRIFEIFNRLHVDDEYEGTGIGLAICREIVERHDGRIWVESEPGEGSTFYFTIPE